MAGTIPFLFALQKINETISLRCNPYRPCSATFQLTVEPRSATVFSLTLPDNFTALLSIKLKDKFKINDVYENGLGFR